jgi:thiol:disulfide interchange protein DsbD
VSIIAGQGKSLTTRKAFGLSLTYVLAMSFTYASAGVLAGYAGSYVQAFFQNEWVITIFSLIFILLALSLFGFYELQIPHSWQHKITEYSNKQIGGTYLGVAIMGFLATLIVSPCVTAPLVGVLSYIGNTGNMLVGGVALFVMGLGMGLPLIIVGIGGGKLLPKSGSWLNVIKVIVGILLLGVAIWMLSRIVSDQTTIVLISILVIGSSIYSGRLSLKYHGIANKLLQVTSIILFLYGLALFIGVLMGNISLLQPLKMKQVTATQNQTDIKISFYYVKNVNDLQAQLMNAKNMHKPVFLDFYADWCVSCKMMDRYVLTDQKVKELLQSFVLLRADMTANTADDIALAKHFKMIGPPVVIFFDANGKQIQPAIVGEVATKELIKRSEQVLQNHN